jgi:hypothetical protein
VDVEVNGHNCRVDKVVKKNIFTLMKQHQFTKCYGPRHLMSDLQQMNISKNKIPSYKQLQNKMFYFCHNKLMYININEVNPLEDKLRPLVFKGDELEEQPFVYHYKCDANNEPVLGDGTDE